MSDRKFICLLFAMSLTAIAVVAVWRYPDVVKAKETRQLKLGEYVYVDQVDVIHASRKCPKLNYKGFKSRRIELTALREFMRERDSSRGYSICPNCVDDKDYETIVSMEKCSRNGVLRQNLDE